MRRALLPALALATVLATAGACGEDEPTAGGTASETASESASASPSESPSEGGTEDHDGHEDGGHEGEALEIEVEFEGGSVKPNGERIEVGVDQPVEFVVEADAAGSLHVHSSPEQELDYDAGTTTFPPLTFDRPGVVEVESHDLGVVVVQLEVK